MPANGPYDDGPADPVFTVRAAVEKDAGQIVSVLREIARDRVYTAITEPWSEARQQRYMRGLSRREAIHVAEDRHGKTIGYQVLDLWAPTIASMAHVGQVGTFIQAGWRRRGVGAALFGRTRAFALSRQYAKFVVQVRSGNAPAQSFYRQLGFQDCGRLARQVRVDGMEEDEILMELFL
jgi:L-amino acid N-acyltransferase YncA